MSGSTEPSSRGRYTTATVSTQRTENHHRDDGDRRHSEDLPEQQRVHLRGVPVAAAEEELTEPQHEHEAQRRRHITSGARPQRGDRHRTGGGRDTQTEEWVGAHQDRGRGAGEGTVRNRMRQKRIPAQDDEEPHHTRDDPDQGTGDPGIDQKRLEHQLGTGIATGTWRRRPADSTRARR